MKKLLTFLAALLVVAGVGAAGPAKAVANCTSNIVDGSANYSSTTSSLFGTISTGANALTPVPTCKSVSYSAIVSYNSSGTHVVQTTSQRGDGTSISLNWSFSPITSDDNNTFCVALFSSKGNTIEDVAPTTADLNNPPTPVFVGTPASPNGYSCSSSGWVAINAQGSSGGGVGGFSS
jgi:hypothetical protein